MYLRIALGGLLVLWATVPSLGGPAASRPAPAADSQAELNDCIQNCRQAFTAIEEALRFIDHGQADSSRPSDDRGHAGNMDSIRARLIQTRNHVSRCLLQLETLQEGAPQMAQAVALSSVWSCPMHTQVRQDKPGNCRICDATLQPVPTRGLTTQPALAWFRDHEHGDAQDPIGRLATGR